MKTFDLILTTMTSLPPWPCRDEETQSTPDTVVGPSNDRDSSKRGFEREDSVYSKPDTLPSTMMLTRKKWDSLCRRDHRDGNPLYRNRSAQQASLIRDVPLVEKKGRTGLNVVNVDLLLLVVFRRLLVRAVVAKLEEGLAVLALVEVVVLVDLGVLGQLAVRLEGTGLVGRVL